MFNLANNTKNTYNQRHLKKKKEVDRTVLKDYATESFEHKYLNKVICFNFFNYINVVGEARVGEEKINLY